MLAAELGLATLILFCYFLAKWLTAKQKPREDRTLSQLPTDHFSSYSQYWEIHRVEAPKPPEENQN